MFYILVLTTTLLTSHGYPTGIPTDYIIVTSAEDAATVLWQRQTRRTDGANVRGSLWRVDMAAGTVDPVPMPTIKFEGGPKAPAPPLGELPPRITQ